MPRLILFNKPYGVLSQFTDAGGRPTLASYLAAPDVRVAGRLDRDSEGLLALTDDGVLQARLAHPRHKQPKTYWAQVEGAPDDAVLERLRRGIELNDGPTRPAQARRIAEPDRLWPREPPIRYRAAIPATWLEITLREGRNRQVRRMTAAVGHPTLRLIRCRIGDWTLGDLRPGQWRDAVAPRTRASAHDLLEREPPTAALTLKRRTRNPTPPMDHDTGHLLTDLPTALAAERFDTLLRGAGCRLERIISIGHTTAPGDWFDQHQDEWVVLLQGRAAVRFADEQVARSLAAGDYLWIPAHCRHRVEWTSAIPPAVWLALHVENGHPGDGFSPASA